MANDFDDDVIELDDVTVASSGGRRPRGEVLFSVEVPWPAWVPAYVRDYVDAS